MKYTPRDIHHQTFPTRFLRGLHPDAVQEFQAAVASDMEELLQQKQQLEGRVQELQAELLERQAQEDDIRRAIVSADRMAHDLKENALRESELLLAQAHAQAQEIMREQERRSAQLELTHQERASALEIEFRTRLNELERQAHELTLQQEREHARRTAQLEAQFSDQYLDLTSRLQAARQEYTQFLNGYRALVSSFSELSSRHLLPEANPLPQPARKAADAPPASATPPRLDQQFS